MYLFLLLPIPLMAGDILTDQTALNFNQIIDRKNASSKSDIEEAKKTAQKAAEFHRKRKDLRKGAELYEKAVLKYPDPSYYYELGNCLIDLHDSKGAFKAFIISGYLNYKDKHLAFYNAACASSLDGDTEQALYYLQKAIHYGYMNFAHIRQDSDMDFIRKAPEFNKILSSYEPLNLAERSLVGLWRQDVSMGAGQPETYDFSTDKSFTRSTSQYDCSRRIISESGSWRVDKGMLVLLISERRIREGGRLVPGGGSCSGRILEDFTEKIVQMVPQEERRFPFPPISIDPQGRYFDLLDLGCRRCKFWRWGYDPVGR